MQLHLHEWGDHGAPAVVCLHGVSTHGRRFRRLAEDRLADRFRVLAPDLRGHGSSGWEPPWDLATQVEDVLETISAAGVERAAWIGHSYGGRLVLEIAAREPERIERAVLLDPAIQILPHVGFDFAERERDDRSFASPEEAIQIRLDEVLPPPRSYLEEEVQQHLLQGLDGRFRYHYCHAAVVAMYSDLCTEPPPVETLRAPALLVHSLDFGLVLDEQVAAYRDRAEIVPVPGGHVVYWDAYAETAGAIERFLESLPVAS